MESLLVQFRCCLLYNSAFFIHQVTITCPNSLQSSLNYFTIWCPREQVKIKLLLCPFLNFMQLLVTCLWLSQWSWLLHPFIFIFLICSYWAYSILPGKIKWQERQINYNGFKRASRFLSSFPHYLLYGLIWMLRILLGFFIMRLFLRPDPSLQGIICN